MLHPRPLVMSLCGFTALVMTAAGVLAGGRTDRLNDRAFVKTIDKKLATSVRSLVVAPVAISPTMGRDFFAQGREAAFQPLLAAANGYLDSLGLGRSVPLPSKGAPEVFVGSSESESAPADAGELRTEADTFAPMVLGLTYPSKDWKRALATAQADGAFDGVLLVWVGFSEYPKRRSGMFGKQVHVGTGYSEPIRLLSDELEDVEIVQFTGALVTGDGKVVRAGAEGFLAQDAPFWVQVLEAGKAIDDDTLLHILDRDLREDLPGRPPKWSVALHNLVVQLLGRQDEVIGGGRS